jgi:hypothetical protein
MVQLGSIVALTGCGGPLSTLSAAGPAADAIATLWWVMLVGSAAIFALVLGLPTPHEGFVTSRVQWFNSDRPWR